jgi:tubulin beta
MTKSGLLKQNSANLFHWIAANIKTSYCDVAPKGLKTAATSLINSNSIAEVLTRVSYQFHNIFLRRAFLHRYIAEAMYEMHF